jgi:hypothetical protein
MCAVIAGIAELVKIGTLDVKPGVGGQGGAGGGGPGLPGGPGSQGTADGEVVF